jgi:hypothetical protein
MQEMDLEPQKVAQHIVSMPSESGGALRPDADFRGL